MAHLNRISLVSLVALGVAMPAFAQDPTTQPAAETDPVRGDVVAVHSLRRGAAEALEAIAHGDHKSSKVVGRRIEEIELPRGATIGAIVRTRAGDALQMVRRNARDTAKSEVIIAHHDTMIESGDHVIVFVENRRIIPKVEKLFQVSVGFF